MAEVVAKRLGLPLNHPFAARFQLQTITSTQQEEAECVQAIDYLREVIQRLGGAPGQWRCDTVVGESVAEGIVNFADREGVEVIAMYTHDRKGLAKLIRGSVAEIRGSVAEEVKDKAAIEVEVFPPQELVASE